MVVRSGRRVRLAGSAGLVIPLMLGLAAPALAAPASHPGVVRGGNTWLLRDTLTGGPATTTFTDGAPGDGIHVMGDWDGDGDKTPGIVRIQGDFQNSHYVWYLRNSNTAGVADVPPFAYGRPSFGFEEPGDSPIVGDWDGDGTDTPGVIRGLGQGTLRWLLRDSNSGGPADIALSYGRGFDEAAVGDWDGDGIDGVGVTRDVGTNLSWLLRNALTSGPAQISFGYGRTDDRPVVWR